MIDIYTPTYNQHKNPRVIVGDIVRTQTSNGTYTIGTVNAGYADLVGTGADVNAYEISKLVLLRRGLRQNRPETEATP